MTLPKPYARRRGHTIYHADGLDIMARMEDDSVDAVFTDPPYSSGARQAAQLRSRGSMRTEEGPWGKDRWFGSDNLTAHGFTMLVRLVAVEALRITKRDGHLFCFIDWRQAPTLIGAIEAAGWSPAALLVWDKIDYGMGSRFRQQAEFIVHATKGLADNFIRHDLGTVFRRKRDPNNWHPTAKPPELVEEILSAVPGEIILDPFMGAGSTLIAADRLGRRGIGIDNARLHCQTAARRLSERFLQLTG